jgi:preprotein translocase subunit SecA
VLNDQRKAIISERKALMELSDFSETAADMRHAVIDDLIKRHIPERSYPDLWDIDGLKKRVAQLFGTDLPLDDWSKMEGEDEIKFGQRLKETIGHHARVREEKFGSDFMRAAEKHFVLEIMDGLWQQHMEDMGYLRNAIGLRGYGQRDPLHEYKFEALAMFENMMNDIREQVTGYLMHVEPAPPPVEESPQSEQQQERERGGGPKPPALA